MIKSCDGDGDGKLSEQEVARLVRKLQDMGYPASKDDINSNKARGTKCASHVGDGLANNAVCFRSSIPAHTNETIGRMAPPSTPPFLSPPSPASPPLAPPKLTWELQFLNDIKSVPKDRHILSITMEAISRKMSNRHKNQARNKANPGHQHY